MALFLIKDTTTGGFQEVQGDVRIVADITARDALTDLTGTEIIHVIDDGTGNYVRYQVTATTDGTYANSTVTELTDHSVVVYPGDTVSPVVGFQNQYAVGETPGALPAVVPNTTLSITQLTAADKAVATVYEANAAGDTWVEIETGNSDAVEITAGEALTAGDFVYIDAAGEAVLASAAAASTLVARGYVVSDAAAAAVVDVFFEGSNNALAGLTIGDNYYLSETTAGGITNVAPSASTELLQYVGFATSATTLTFEPARPVRLA